MSYNYPHVTTILGRLRKEGLENWFKSNTAEFCDAESNRGKAVGTVIHKAIQSHIENDTMDFQTDYPDEVRNCIKGFFAFKTEHRAIKLKKAEMSIESQKYGYRGTLDCVADFKGRPIVIDWKTGKCNVGTPKEVEKPPIYPEMEFQVSAYVQAYNETAAKLVEDGAILVLAKDRVAFNYLELGKNKMDEMLHEVFLPLLHVYNYQSKEGQLYGFKNRGGQRASYSSKGNGHDSRKSAKLPVEF